MFYSTFHYIILYTKLCLVNRFVFIITSIPRKVKRISYMFTNEDKAKKIPKVNRSLLTLFYLLRN